MKTGRNWSLRKNRRVTPPVEKIFPLIREKVDTAYFFPTRNNVAPIDLCPHKPPQYCYNYFYPPFPDEKTRITAGFLGPISILDINVGASTQTRTADLVLTKDALCLLSYGSTSSLISLSYNRRFASDILPLRRSSLSNRSVSFDLIRRRSLCWRPRTDSNRRPPA